MKKFSVILLSSIMLLTGCSSPVVEPHLSESVNNPLSIDSVAVNQSKSGSNILHDLIDKKASCYVESSVAPKVDKAVCQESVMTLNMYLQLPVELTNAIQFYLEMYNVDFTSIESYEEIGNLNYLLTTANGRSAEILLTDDYLLVGTMNPLLLCLDYSGKLLESYDGKTWKNYDGNDHNYSEVNFGTVRDVTADIINQNTLIISSRTDFKADYSRQIAETLVSEKIEAIKEIYEVSENMFEVTFESDESLLVQIMLLNANADGEKLHIQIMK